MGWSWSPPLAGGGSAGNARGRPAPAGVQGDRGRASRPERMDPRRRVAETGVGIMRPPGTQLLVWAGRLLGRRTVERIVKPVVADLRWECDHAPVNNTWRRRRILAAGYVGFWKAIVLYGFAAAVH